ncbi:MAG: aminoglycoside phosphotransferase family protein [bacterium]
MESVLQKITEEYNLNFKVLDKVTQGFLSDNYILADGQKKYFLKKYRFKNKERMSEVHSAKRYFFEGGIPVIMPLLTDSDESFFEHNGSFYALFPFILDHQLKPDEITKDAIVSLGETLARLHLRGKESKLKINEFFRPWDKEERMRGINQILEKISLIENKTDFDIQAEKNILLKKSVIESNNRTYESFNFLNDHLIHGDYMIGNVFFDDQNNVSNVFDFEKTEYAPRFFELFRSMIYTTFFDENITEETLANTKLYLDSYLNIYPMSKEELDDAFTAYYINRSHSYWVEAEHYLRGNTRADELLESDIARMNYFSENFEVLKKYLIE